MGKIIPLHKLHVLPNTRSYVKMQCIGFFKSSVFKSHCIALYCINTSRISSNKCKICILRRIKGTYIIVAFSFSPVTPTRSEKWCLVSLTLGCEVKDVVQGKPVDSLQGAGSDQR